MKDHFVVGERAHAGSERLLIRQAANLLATDLSLGELFERLTRMLAEFIDSSVVFIALARPDGRHAIEYFYDHGEVRRYPHIPLNERSRARAVIRTGEVVWGNDPSEWAPEGAIPINEDRPWTNDTVSAIFVPMTAGGKTVGCLSVQSVREGAYTRDEVDVVGAIGHFLGVAVENQRMYQALARTAEYDPATGLANHSKLVRELDSALITAASTSPTTAILLNVVNFAMFNETYGYAEGDEVLRRIAEVLRGFEDVDEGVTVGRFGGDVFMVILKEQPPEMIATFIDRLRARLSELAYIGREQTVPISLACGYAIAPMDAGNRQDLVALCVHRTRLSRKQGCTPVGEDEIDAYTGHGNFSGIETIVEGLLERDPYTRVHLLQVNSMAKMWAQYNFPLDHHDLAHFLQASLLHDVGKLLISDRILVKPARLTPQEYLAAQQHAIYGKHILEQHEGFYEVASIVGQHHERWDGAGYPRGLAGQDIHILARAVAILDAFSAMVADRPYHRGITENAALVELQRCAGTQFDPDLVARFVAWRENGDPPQLA